MFSSKDDAREFRDEIVQELDRIETDGWHVSPTLEGATLLIDGGVARVRGQLDGGGYRVRDQTDSDTEADGWDAKLAVLPA